MDGQTVSISPILRPFRATVNYFAMIRQDVKAAFERDPAARSSVEIVLLYPGLHAIWIHRISHWLWMHRARLLARWFSQLALLLPRLQCKRLLRLQPPPKHP